MSTFVTGEGAIADWRWAYAGFGRRLAGIAIDGFVISAIMEVLAFAGAGQSTLWTDPAESPVQGWLTVTLQAIVSAVYFIVLNGRGATLGKRVVGIRVVDAGGRPPGLAKAVIRYLIPLFLGSVGLITNALVDLGNADASASPFDRLPGAFWVVALLTLGVMLYDNLSMLWHKDRQTVHDRMAGTYVVRRWWG